MKKTGTFPEYVPNDLVEWFASCNVNAGHFDPFIFGHGMWQVWDWFQAGRPFGTIEKVGFDENGSSKVITEEYPTPSLFLICLSLGRFFPGKPFDLTPKKRREYFSKVKKHARALTELLSDSDFDGHMLDHLAEPIAADKAEQDAGENIRSIIDQSKSEGSRNLLAYEADEHGNLYRHVIGYPDSELVEILRRLIDWASTDHNKELYGIKAVRHSGIEAKKTWYLARICASLESFGVEMPYGHYATVTNAALNLSARDELNEESAAKKIQRIKSRQGPA